MPSKFVDVRKVIHKNKQAAKCPFLQECILKSVTLAVEASFFILLKKILRNIAGSYHCVYQERGCCLW